MFHPTPFKASNIWLNTNSPQAAQALFDNYPLSITFMVDLKNDAEDKEEGRIIPCSQLIEFGSI